MLPKLEGMIARRVLLNFRADPEVARHLVPPPLEVLRWDGAAIVGVCLIRLEQLRPSGLPSFLGMSAENMAHRIAVRYPTREGMNDGVFIWRRESNRKLITWLGGRLFPGVHHPAKFRVTEDERLLEMEIQTASQEADVSFRAERTSDWTPTSAFRTFEDASGFFERGDCGFSCSLAGTSLEGMRLRTLKWEPHPLAVEDVHSAFYEDARRFPRGSIEFDCALLMRGVPHEWQELAQLPSPSRKELTYV